VLEKQATLPAGAAVHLGVPVVDRVATAPHLAPLLAHDPEGEFSAGSSPATATARGRR
jgi:hypothetical protein